MATINFSSNTYSGEVLEDLLVYTAKGNETYEAGLIHVKPGIQKRFVLPSIQLGNIIQDNVPTPTTQGGVPSEGDTELNKYTIAERYLDPEDLMVYLEFNPRDFEDYWRFAQPEGPLVFRELDPKVQSKMLRLLLDKKDSYINDAIWNAVKGGTNTAKYGAPAGGTELGGMTAGGRMKYFNGAMARVLDNIAAGASEKEKASGKVIVAGTTVLDTGEKVEQALYAIWKACPTHVRKSKKLKFVLNWELWDLYDEYLTKRDHKYVENPQENRRLFKGKEIVVIDGAPENTIFLGKFSSDSDSCLWMAIDYATDEESVKVERLQANSELYFFQMRLKMDVNIVLPSEIVVWTAYTSKA